jgi:predicted Zn-dependent peptidase
MISSMAEYDKAESELHDLEERLQRLQESTPVGAKGFTKAGIRKMIARLHEELALFEGSEEARAAKSP